MQKALILCLFVGLSSLMSCSSTTEPDETTPPEDDFELIAQANIGPEGGILEAEGFSLTVPPGAIDSPSSLDLYVSDVDVPYGDNARSSLFRLEGLPVFLNEDLTLAIQTNGSLSGGSFVADGVYGIHSETGEEEIAYYLRDVTVSADTLIASISGMTPAGDPPVRRQAPRDDALEMIRFFLGLTSIESHATERFKIASNQRGVSEEDLETLIAILETQHDLMVEDWRLPWDFDDNIWPIHLQIIPGSGESAGTWMTGTESDRKLSALILLPGGSVHPEFEINLIGSLGAQLVHIFQYVCEDGWEAAYSQAAYIHQAFRDWSEEAFTLNTEYTRPSGLTGNETYPLDGMTAALRSGEPHSVYAEYGHGLSPVAKFLMDDSRFGIEGFRRFYTDIKAGREVMTALLAAVETNVEVWLPEFFGKYFARQIYDVDHSLLTGNPIDTCELSSTNDLYELNQGSPVSFHDLSAGYFPVTLAGEFEDNAVVKIAATGSGIDSEKLSVILFAVEAGGLRYLDHGHDWILENIQADFVGQGIRTLSAVVVNSAYAENWLGSTDVRVILDIDETPVFNSIRFGLDFEAWLYQEPNGPTDHWPNYSLPILMADHQITPPSFSAPVNMDIEYGGGDFIRYIGTISGEINDDNTVLNSLNVNITSTYYVSNEEIGSGMIRVILSGPLETRWQGSYAVQEEYVCPYITDIQMSTNTTNRNEHLTNWNCNSNSSLGVSFTQ